MGGIFPHHHQLFRVFEGERPQQHGIHGAKDYSVCADTERDRNNSNAREGRILRQRAQRIAQILPEVGKHVDFLFSSQCHAGRRYPLLHMFQLAA